MLKNRSAGLPTSLSSTGLIKDAASLSGSSLYASLSIFSVLRFFWVFSLFVCADLLHNHSLPVLPFTVLLVFFSGGILSLFQRSIFDLFTLTKRQIIILLVNGIFLLAFYFFFCLGLKTAGPLRAVLINDYSEPLFIHLPLLFCGIGGNTAFGMNKKKKQGLWIMFLAYIILFFFQESNVHDIFSSQQVAAITKDASAEQTVNELYVLNHEYDLYFFSMQETMVGMVSLVLAQLIAIVSHAYERKNAKEFGGRKRMHAMSMLGGGICFLPIVFLQSLISSHSMMGSGHLTAAAYFASLLFLVLFMVLLSFYVDALAARTNSTLLPRLSIVVSFLSAVVIDSFRGDGRAILPTAFSAALIGWGIHRIIQSPAKKDESLTTMNGGLDKSTAKESGSLLHGVSSFAREYSVMFRHLMADRTTMRIFLFLCLNFAFMFVELIYGYLSNSLGLISDAGHMLFDTVSLAIGLYASFISKTKPNGTYTYGFGRYEIISGYVNGVFLLFIAYFIMVESIERLFEPAEIVSDSLIIVSVLGFGVNMIGLIFFHDHGHGGHAEEDAHGHAAHDDHHGHSHGAAGTCDDSHAEDDHHGHSHGDDHGHSHGARPPAVAKKSQSQAHHGHSHNHNVDGIFLHILADALGSVGVIISSICVYLFGWTRMDALCSMIISILITLSVIPLIRNTIYILIQRVPDHRLSAVKDALFHVQQLDSVLSYRLANVWAFNENELIATLHVHVKEEADEQRIVQQITDIMRDPEVGVTNLTVQVEKNQFLNHHTAQPNIGFLMDE